MIYTWLRASGMLTLLFAIMLVGLREKDLDDDQMRALFASSRCAAPCFLDMYPGVTTRDEALALLNAQPWIGSVDASAMSANWSWSDTAPAFLRSAKDDSAGGYVTFSNGIVVRIGLRTPITLGYFLSVFGFPEDEVFVFSDHAFVDHVNYHQEGFEIEAIIPCAVKMYRDTWSRSVSITWPASPIPELAGNVLVSNDASPTHITPLSQMFQRRC